MIDRLLSILVASEEAPDANELADALWLAERLPERAGSDEAQQQVTTTGTKPSPSRYDPPNPVSPAASFAADTASHQVTMHLATEEATRTAGRNAPAGTIAGVPGVPAITDGPAIIRALRPLRATVRSRTEDVVDEAATAERIADTGLWVPELRPGPERWLDLVLVVDASASMVVWERTILEFRALLTQLGAFRDIRVVLMNTDRAPVIPGHYLNPGGRRLVLVLSDCVGRAWTEGNLLEILETAARTCPIAIVQLLPQRLWDGCGLAFVPAWISAKRVSGNLTCLRAEDREGDSANDAWAGLSRCSSLTRVGSLRWQRPLPMTPPNPLPGWPFSLDQYRRRPISMSL